MLCEQKSINLKTQPVQLSGSSMVSPRLTDLVKLAQECCYHSNLAVAAQGVIVLSNIVISCPEKGELLWWPIFQSGVCLSFPFIVRFLPPQI